MKPSRLSVEQSREISLWVCYAAVLPTLLLLAGWLVPRMFESDVAPSYSEVFGTGDVLPVAGALLLSVLGELQIIDRKTTALRPLIHQLTVLVAAFAIFVSYGAMKTSGIRLLRSEASPVATVTSADTSKPGDAQARDDILKSAGVAASATRASTEKVALTPEEKAAERKFALLTFATFSIVALVYSIAHSCYIKISVCPAYDEALL